MGLFKDGHGNYDALWFDQGYSDRHLTKTTHNKAQNMCSIPGMAFKYIYEVRTFFYNIYSRTKQSIFQTSPDGKVHGAKMGPSGADRTQVGPMLAPLTWAHLGPTGPRWAQCWLHELCYLGLFQLAFNKMFLRYVPEGPMHITPSYVT